MGALMQVESRDSFPELLRLLGLYGTYVEVGVDDGAYSRVFLPSLAAKQFQRLLLVDPWDPKLFYRPTTQEEMDERYRRIKNMELFNPGVSVKRMKSADAAREIPDAWVDFVYLDGLHDYENVKTDIAAWRPKIRSGGLLAGHDINMDGVRLALDELCADEKIKWQRVTREADPSWYLQV